MSDGWSAPMERKNKRQSTPKATPSTNRYALPQNHSKSHRNQMQATALSSKPVKSRNVDQEFPSKLPAVPEGRPRRQPPNFVHRADGLGTDRWRRREGPSGQVNIPPLIQQSVDQAEIENLLVNVMARSNTYMSLQLTTGEAKILIWGNNEDSRLARKAVESWLHSKFGSARQRNPRQWPKPLNMNGNRRTIQEELFDVKDDKDYYRRHPPLDFVQPHGAILRWHHQDYRAEDVLGANCEALDKLRIESRCHILYDPASRAFRIYGPPDRALLVQSRLRTLSRQIVARLRVAAPAFVLVQSGNDIVHSQVQHVQTSCRHLDVPMTWTVRSTGRSVQSSLDLSPTATALIIREKVMPALQHQIRVYRGNVHCRVALGAFILDQFKTSSTSAYSIHDFKDMLDDSSFSGHVTDGLCVDDESFRACMTAICDDGTLVSPTALVRRLQDVPPTYTAVVTCPDKDGDFVMTKSWQEHNNDRNYHQVALLWERYDRASQAATPIIDINMINLPRNVAWALRFDSRNLVDEARVPDSLRNYGLWYCNIAGDPEKDDCWITIDRLALKSKLTQSITWRYAFPHSDYILEISRHKTTSYGLDNSGARKTCSGWQMGLAIVNKGWETVLAENSLLPIGMEAGWKADLQTWFPADDISGRSVSPGVGIEDLLAKMAWVTSVVSSIKRSV